MKYKALFLDLDGTTVRIHEDQPSPRVIEAVLQADKKLSVCIATGRLMHQALPIIKILKLSGLCIVANGMQIYDPRKKQILKEIAMNQSDVPYVEQIVRKYTIQAFYFDGKDEFPIDAKQPKNHVCSFYIPLIHKKDAEKIISDLSFLPEVTTHKLNAKSDDNNLIGLEICHVKATKQHGIMHVAEFLGIKTHEIIGIGDGYNDFPLLMACGLRVAMGNAVADLKAIADFIAPTVEDDGVAVVIEKYILSSISSP